MRIAMKTRALTTARGLAASLSPQWGEGLRVRCRLLPMKHQKPLDPMPVGVLGPMGKVLEPHHLPALIQKPRLWIGNESAQRPVWSWQGFAHEIGQTTNLSKQEIQPKICTCAAELGQTGPR